MLRWCVCRQLSEENANLQESVEKESTEKKRLSRNNEELMWRLQTSPLASPCSSPLHRSFSTSPAPSSPFLSSSPSSSPPATPPLTVTAARSPPTPPSTTPHPRIAPPPQPIRITRRARPHPLTAGPPQI